LFSAQGILAQGETMAKKRGEPTQAYRVSTVSDWDFLVAFTNYFGLRRGAEILGITLLLRASGLIPATGAFSINQLADKLKERGVSSKAATYRAMTDLKAFAEYFEDESLTINQLVDRLGKVDLSRMGEVVVE
jgi:uncharacterized protein YneR